MDSVNATVAVRYLLSSQPENKQNIVRKAIEDAIGVKLDTEKGEYASTDGYFHRIYTIRKEHMPKFFKSLCNESSLISQLKNSDNSSHYTELLRIRLRFYPFVERVEIPGEQKANPKHEIKQNRENPIYNQLIEEYEKITNYWTEELCNKDIIINNFMRSNLTNQNDSLYNILIQHRDFFIRLDLVARNGINPEIMSMVQDSLNVLLDMMKQYFQHVKDFVGMKSEDDKNRLPEFHARFLKTLHDVTSSIGSFMHNIVRTHSAFWEEGGLFENDITVTTKLALGYYYYIKKLCSLLLLQDVIGDYKQVACFVRFDCFVRPDAMLTPVSVTEHFAILSRLHQESMVDDKDFKGLLTFRLSHHIAFDFRDVRRVLTHECLHFLGNRKRSKRAKAIVKALCIWLEIHI